jgi:CHASE3 domain sensor protein
MSMPQDEASNVVAVDFGQPRMSDAVAVTLRVMNEAAEALTVAVEALNEALEAEANA